MNERIRGLLNEATSGLEPDLSEQRTVTSNEMEKFAVLIVKECIAICQDIDGEDNIDAKSGRQDCVVEIQEYFGVAQSNIEAAESIHSDKGYSLGTPEAQEAFESKREKK